MHKLPIKFKKLTLRNFMSYGNNVTELHFDKLLTSLIIAEDLDNTSGTGSNGSGKSATLNALSYALFDNPISKINVDGLINNINKKNMEVCVWFDIGTDEYKIKRARKTKEGSYVRIEKNGVDITDTKPNAQIENIIGMPLTLFKHVVLFSANNTPFLDLKGPEQTELMEFLFGLLDLSVKADKIKEISKNTQQSINIEETKINQIQQEHNRHLQLIETTKKKIIDWDISKQQNIEKYTKELETYKDFDFDGQLEMMAVINAAQQEINLLQKDINNKQSELERFSSSIKKNMNELSKLEQHKCPYCLQDYHDTKDKIKEIEKQLVDASVSSETIEKELNVIKQNKLDKDKDVKMIQPLLKFKSTKEVMDLKVNVGQLSEKIKNLIESSNPFTQSLKDIENGGVQNIDYSKINELKKVLEHEKFLIKILTKKDSFVRKYLLDKNLPFLNKRLHDYLKELGLPHKVEFTSELTANISSLGRELEFGNLSNGQRSRVNLALALSFRDVLEKIHQPINICFFDEVLDVGMDSNGVQSAAKLLKRKAKDEQLSMFIISHRDEVKHMFDNVITIQMHKGFSNIKTKEENV